MPKRILFVCHANSVRSPMAEGWGRYLSELSGSSIEASSAGFYPSGVHPLAVEVMREVGIDISGHVSRRLNEYILDETDYLITCTDSVKSLLGELPEEIKYIHWPITNPDAIVNGAVTQEQAYCLCRDDLKIRVGRLLEEIG